MTWKEEIQKEEEVKKGFVEDNVQTIIALHNAITSLAVPMKVYYENRDNASEVRIYKNFYEDAVKMSSELKKEARKQYKDDTPEWKKGQEEFYRDLRERE